MFLWKKWDSPLCPMCHLAEESTLHVLQCPHPDQTRAWHKAVDILRQWLANADTNPRITSGIVSFLHTRGLGSLAFSAHSSCQLAASDQEKIGFFGLLLGCLSRIGLQYKLLSGLPKAAVIQFDIGLFVSVFNSFTFLIPPGSFVTSKFKTPSKRPNSFLLLILSD